MNDTPETDEARKARLLDEAKALKAPVDANWTADQIEKVVAKKRATVAAAKAAEAEKAKAAEAQAVAEAEKAAPDGDNSAGEGADWGDDAMAALKVDLEAAHGEIARLKGEVERLTRKTKDQEALVLALQTDKDAAELALFDLQQKTGEAPADKPEASEDFVGKKEAEPARPSPAPAQARTAPKVKVTVTKHGHDKIFTGKDDGSRYSRGAVFEVEAETAATLEANGLVETD